MQNKPIQKYNTPFVLAILDGWGVAQDYRGNAITQAKTPSYDYLVNHYFSCTLQAAGESVGLPWGEMGNSEVGHLNIGAGKIIYQDLPKITKAISQGSFFTNPAFLKAIAQVKSKNSNLHLMGLLSDGGVHSYNEHLYALLELASKHKLEKVLIHCFLDGRDVSFNSGLDFIADLEAHIKKLQVNAIIATVSGRFWAMDRDNHWDRVARAYKAMVHGEAEHFSDSAEESVKGFYNKKVYDEEIPPIIIGSRQAMNPNDAVIFFNYRADRAREITKAFAMPSFDKFARGDYLKDLVFVAFTQYDKDLPVEIAFPTEEINNPLAKVISDAGLFQLHIAETEKYAHVTFFFNGGREEPYPQEERILVPSPSVDSYDKKPAMSAPELTARLLRSLNTGRFGFIVVNFANPDMVAHTGNIQATIKAVEQVDESLRQITDSVLSIGGNILITADHGNAEEVINMNNGEIDKEHSAFPVPCIIAGKNFLQFGPQKNKDLLKIQPSGILSDIAPTILKIMGIPKPKEMDGRELV